MPLTSPSELRAFLTSLGVKPKRSLSQNFLIDRNVLNKLLAVAEVQAGEKILDIGAGPGAITEALLEWGAHVTAVETDPLFAEALHRFSSVEVIHGDILTLSLEHFVPPYKIVSNLPYHLTAPILTKCVREKELFSSITVIVQEEVARRITASPNRRTYSSFTLFLNFYADVRYAFPISHHCFYPRPKVDSAVVQLFPKTPPPVDPESFFALVRTAFQQRRKQLRTTLGDRVVPILERLQLPSTARPENLSLEHFLEVFLDTKE